MRKEDLYRRIKIAGMISFIPLLLAAGPLAGYFAGDYLEKRFRMGPYALFFCIGMGFITGIIEAIRVIRLVLKIDKDGCVTK